MTARGAVNARLEAVLRVRVRGPTGTEAVVDAVIDTGYSGLFTLPAATAVALGLVRRSGGQATLADGSIRQFDVFAAELEWDGGWRGVDVYALGDEVLAGMRLLAGHGLWVEVADGGAVEVDPLPPAGTP